MIRLLSALLLSAILLAPTADAQYTLTRSVIASGATDASGGSYTLRGTIGQPAVGMSSGGSYTLCTGFWCGELDPGALEATLTALLQGGWTGSAMRTTLVGAAAFPTSQPYNTAPWNYAGTESNATPPSSTTDWMLVQLRTGTASATAVASVAALVLEDGSIVDASGSGPVQIAVAPGSYYVVLYHRNHVPVISASTIDFNSGAASYDFTAAAGQALGTDPMAGLGVGDTAPFALWGGDGNADEQVTSPDFNLYSSATASGATGYEMADYNLDAQVTSPDFNIYSASTAAGANSGVPALRPDEKPTDELTRERVQPQRVRRSQPLQRRP